MTSCIHPGTITVTELPESVAGCAALSATNRS